VTSMSWAKLSRTLIQVASLVVLALAVVPWWAGAAWPATATERSELARIDTYLNAITTLKARFVQVAPDGALSEGMFYLRRPGRLRFEYDAPNPILVVADRVWVVFYDKELGQVDRLPLDSTPIAVLTRSEIKLEEAFDVTGLAAEPGLLQVSLRDRESPDEGQITLVFSDRPLALRQWLVEDAQGLTTQITLYDIELNIALAPELFIFEEPASQLRHR